MWIIIFYFLFRSRRTVVARKIIKKRKLEGNTEMKELAKKYPDYRFHLLGSHDPRELRAHKDIKQIQSFDSGYPVKLGVMGVKFGDEKEKPNIIIDDFCNKSLDEDIKNLIVNNIITMKKF